MRASLCALSLAFGFTASFPQAADAANDPARNAALRYWIAFEVMTRFEIEPRDYLDPEKPKALDGSADLFLNTRTMALLMLQRGSSMPYCDWGLHLEDGPGLRLPHLQKSRDLAALGCLNMRRHFENGRPAQAVDELIAVLTLARHLSDHTMIAMLVQFSIETLAYQTAASYLHNLDARGLKLLADRLDKLPASASVRGSVELEREHMVGWFILRIKEHMKPADIEKIAGTEGTFTALFAKEGEAGAIRYLEALQKDYTELAKVLSLPRAQQDLKVEELRKRMEANPFGKPLLPAIEKVRAAEDKMAVRRALFRAAIAVAESGPDAANQIKDPAGTGPFEIKKLDGPGHELRSKLMDKDQPVSLRVGTVKK